MSTSKYCPLIWLFCRKTENKSRTIHEDNIHTLLIEIYKSKHYIGPPIIRTFLDLRETLQPSWQ